MNCLFVSSPFSHFMSTCTKNIFQPKLNYKIHHFATRINLVDYATLDLLLKSDKFVTLTIFANGKNVFLLTFKDGKLLSINSKPVTSHTIIQRSPGNVIYVKNPMKNLSLVFTYKQPVKFRYNNTVYRNPVVTLRTYNL